MQTADRPPKTGTVSAAPSLLHIRPLCFQKAAAAYLGLLIPPSRYALTIN